MSSFVLGLAVICIVLAISAVETGPNRSRELSLVAALAAAAAGGRVLFAFVPNVQPVTIIVAVTGATLGARAGIAAGGAAALLSNTVLGQGPWTAWQMIGWGLVGATAAPLGRLLRNRWALAAFG
ncbi:MAG: energy-coupling factor transport system substrate-specific component, partial [Gaiellales bacterium]|nr:energy-coupling factor transport system substrate-specific component [Gaiellales bacterium]